MTVIIHAIARRFRSVVTSTVVFSAIVFSLDGAAQAPRDAEQVEQLVNYSQCIRENGYPAFPDPAPDGGFRFRIERDSAAAFEKAQQACRDKLPSGFMQRNQAVSAE